jgi:uncharacterized membrane protein YgdD (TMEM256/DUF423 family)
MAGAGNPGEEDLLISGSFMVSGAICLTGVLIFPGVLEGNDFDGALIEGMVTPGEVFGVLFSGLNGYF